MPSTDGDHERRVESVKMHLQKNLSFKDLESSLILSPISKYLNLINSYLHKSVIKREKNRFTLKLEILVDFPASANVLLTQFTMMSSFTFCPSPRSSSTFNVYLKEGRRSAFSVHVNIAFPW